MNVATWARGIAAMTLAAGLLAGSSVTAAAAPASIAAAVAPSGDEEVLGLTLDDKPFTLKGGQFRISAPQGMELVMQTDGNLVLYYLPARAVLWASNTVGRASTFSFQSDGNAVLRDKAGRAVWATGTQTAANTGANHRVLALSGRGQLAVGTASGRILFLTVSRVPATWAFLVGVLTFGPRQESALMQTDGNLVLRAANGRATWASNTAGHPGSFAVLLKNLDFAIYQNGQKLWSTGTAIAGCSTTCRYQPLLLLKRNADGPELRLYAEPGDNPIWSSKYGRYPFIPRAAGNPQVQVVKGAAVGGSLLHR